MGSATAAVLRKPAKRSRSSLAENSEFYLYQCDECIYSSAYKGNLKKHREKNHLVVQLNDNSNHPPKKPELSEVENNNIVTEDENVLAEEMDGENTMEKVKIVNKVECEVCEKKYKNR